MFLSDGAGDVCSREAAQVYYDPPKPSLMSVKNCGMIMEFDCAVSGVPGTASLDSGAKLPCISSAYAYRVGLTVEKLKVAETVHLPDGGTPTCVGQKVRIQNYYGTVTCWVVDLSDRFSLILGESWLEQCKAVLNFADHTCMLHKGRRRVTLTSSTAKDTCNTDSTPKPVPKRLSAMQVKRATCAGCETFLVNISKVEEGVQTGDLQEPEWQVVGCSPSVTLFRPTRMCFLTSCLKDCLLTGVWAHHTT